MSANPGNIGRAILDGLARLLRKKDGNVAPLIALLIVPIVGALAVGGETSSWFTMQRSQQNAADSAVIAAALKGGASYATEAQGVSATYGYKNGGNIAVTPATVTCPTGVPNLVAGALCYQVSINRTVPVYLTKVVGYRGDGTLVGGGSGKVISANAIAGTVTGAENFCLIALNKLTLGGGGSKPSLAGCDLLSGGSMACNGSNADLGVLHAYAVGNNQNCGSPISVSNYAAFSGDPDKTTVINNIAAMPPTSCPTVATISSLSSGVNCFTGNVTLAGNITVNNSDTVLVIKPDASGNGSLNIGSNTLQTAAGASLTIVYTGSNVLQTPVLVSNGGTLNIADPSSGAWQGMVIVEDPALVGKKVSGTNTLDIDFSGNNSSKISLYITGQVYLPNGIFNVGGAINHATYSDHGSFTADSCLILVADTITITGTNAIFTKTTSGCHDAGVTGIPKVPMIALLH